MVLQINSSQGGNPFNCPFNGFVLASGHNCDCFMESGLANFLFPALVRRT